MVAEKRSRRKEMFFRITTLMTIFSTYLHWNTFSFPCYNLKLIFHCGSTFSRWIFFGH